MIRQPIVSIMGHVDHGKTSVLDSIRGTAIAAREAGGITQAIGASIIPVSTIKQACGKLLEASKLKVTIPGLLFVDTPGHAAFVNLRKRGGSLADIAILVIDINDGLMPQTKESIEILKNAKTPFIIAANKVDMIQGWKTNKDSVIGNINEMDPATTARFDTKIYELVGQLYELGLQADRFDRVQDYTKQIAIVPVSAKTKQGIPELLMVLTGLAQKFLEENLKTDLSAPAKASIVEVKEQKGLGTVLDVIIYDGTLSVNDPILVATLNGVIETKVKALFEPGSKADMREKGTKFESVKSVSAATGVRVVAPGCEAAVAGMPLLSTTKNKEEIKAKLQEEIDELVFETNKDGLILKADALGSLEALMQMLKEREISVRKSSIGPITKKDISEAESLLERDPLHAVLLGFNIKKPDSKTNAKIICADIIYQLLDEYELWKKEKEKSIQLADFDNLVSPCKIELMKGYVFRQNNPAVVGIEVLSGILKTRTPMMNLKGKEVALVKGIQKDQENVDKAVRGKQVSVSLPNVTIGRQVQEGNILISCIPESDFRKFKDYKEHLTKDQKEILREVAEIMREDSPMWGV